MCNFIVVNKVIIMVKVYVPNVWEKPKKKGPWLYEIEVKGKKKKICLVGDKGGYVGQHTLIKLTTYDEGVILLEAPDALFNARFCYLVIPNLAGYHASVLKPAHLGPIVHTPREWLATFPVFEGPAQEAVEFHYPDKYAEKYGALRHLSIDDWLHGYRAFDISEENVDRLKGSSMDILTKGISVKRVKKYRKILETIIDGIDMDMTIVKDLVMGYVNVRRDPEQYYPSEIVGWD